MIGRAERVEELAGAGSACSGRARPGRRAAPSSSSSARLRRRLVVAAHRDVLEGHAEARRPRARRSAWLETTSGDVARQLAAPPAPQQLEQAVVVARDEDRHALAPRGERDPPVHPEAARRPRPRTPRSQRPAVARPRRASNSIRMKNAPPSGSVECWSDCTMFAPWCDRNGGHRRDDPRAVRAGQQQARHALPARRPGLPGRAAPGARGGEGQLSLLEPPSRSSA